MRLSIIIVFILAIVVPCPLSAARRPPVRTLPVDTLVRIKMMDEITSRSGTAGDRFRFRVVEDVFHEGRIWIARGTAGAGVIKKVKRAGRFGQNGRLESSFGRISAGRRQKVMLTISKKASQENDQQKMAAGASFLGLVALGPIGLAGGAFIRGKDVTIAKGAELYVATEEDVDW